MSLRILLADDHRIIRQGLRSLLDKQADMEIVGEAEDGREAVELAGKLKPDICVMDVGMPTMNGVEATQRVLSENPHTRVIALSMHADVQFVGRMLEAGASGYLLKDCAFEELATAIRTVSEGRTYLSPRIAAVVVDGYVRRPPAGEAASQSDLTAREREVLQLIAEGGSTKEIAFALNVSIKTIETHRRNMMEKLGIHSVAELTKYAIRRGMTSVDG